MVNFCIIGFTVNLNSTQCLIQLSHSCVSESFNMSILYVVLFIPSCLSLLVSLQLLISVWGQSLYLIVIIKPQAISYTFKQQLRVKTCFSLAHPCYLWYVFYLEKTLNFFFLQNKVFFGEILKMQMAYNSLKSIRKLS